VKANTIDDIIIRLENIMDIAIREKDRSGYFAALYHKVTCAVKEGVARGDFEDGERMERLDVIFASRYLDAWQAWRNKEAVTASWKIAFEKTKITRTLILQHLLLGVNAHINLDLGIAAVETQNGNDLAALRRDFVRINALLSSLLLDVLKDIQRVSPLSSILGLHAKNNKSMLINFTIESARDGAWCFAEDLSNKQEASREFINDRDKEIEKLAQNLSSSKGLLRITTFIIRLFEWNNAAKVITVLRTGKKTKLNDAEEAQDKLVPKAD
jgi:hypothetical protein